VSFPSSASQLALTASPAARPIDCGKVVVQTALGHNEHAHGDQNSTGCEGSFVITPACEADNQLIFYVLNVSYTDAGGPGGASPLTATPEAVLQTRIRQAEHFASSSGVRVEASSDPAGGGGQAIGQIEHGDHVSYNPINLGGIDRLYLRIAPGPLGGTIEARVDSPTGPLVGSVSVAGTGATQPWTTVQMPVTNPGGSHELFLVFNNPLVVPNPVVPGNMLSLNCVEFVGRGVNSAPKATVAADAVTGSAPLTVRCMGGGRTPTATR